MLEPGRALGGAGAIKWSLLDALVAEADARARVRSRRGRPLPCAVGGVRRPRPPSSADAAAIDVLGLHQGYVRGLVEAGRLGRALGLRAHAEPAGVAGGWGGRAVGSRRPPSSSPPAPGVTSSLLSPARPLGLRPLRRTIAVCRVPAGSSLDPEGPLVSDAAHSWYFKPRVRTCSCRRPTRRPASRATPGRRGRRRPRHRAGERGHDAGPALGGQRVGRAEDVRPRPACPSWARIRTVPGLFWLAGQGGYGIQTAPAMARPWPGWSRKPAPPDVPSVTAESWALIGGGWPRRLRTRDRRRRCRRPRSRGSTRTTPRWMSAVGIGAWSSTWRRREARRRHHAPGLGRQIT